MFWLIITILLVVIGTAGLLTGFGSSSSDSKIGGFAVCAISILVWGVLTVGVSVHGVGQRQVGIVYNFAGVITGKRDPGIVWTAPWQHIKTANVGIQREDFILDTNNSAVSQDQQPITANIALNYQIGAENIIGLYKKVGPSWKETLLDSRVLQDFKEVTAQFSAAEITTRRDDLRKLTTARLERELAPYDITVTGFFVKNLGYSKSYGRAIDAKNQQVQKALQAQAKVAQARAEAEQIVAKAKGDAESNRLRAKSLTPAVLTQNAINALNPHVQVIYVPASGNFLIPQIGTSTKP